MFKFVSKLKSSRLYQNVLKNKINKRCDQESIYGKDQAALRSAQWFQQNHLRLVQCWRPFPRIGLLGFKS